MPIHLNNGLWVHFLSQIVCIIFKVIFQQHTYYLPIIQ